MLKKSPSQAELNQLMQTFNSGDYSAAESMAAALTKTYPKSAFGWKILGVSLASQGNMAEAIIPLKKSIVLSPKDAEAHQNLASAFYVLEKFELAETHFRKSIALHSQNSYAYILLAKTLENQKKTYRCRKGLSESTYY